MTIDFNKGNGLVPAIVQHCRTGQVLMLGYMNARALEKTQKEKKVTFFSRSKNRLWTKGEESGHFLHVKKIFPDCDQDTLLILAQPEGPACHRGTTSCFDNDEEVNFIFKLEEIVRDRYENPPESSYVNKLRLKGINKIAQKVGEEATETVIAALTEDREAFRNETSDLLFHLLVLLREKAVDLQEIGDTLRARHQ